VASRGDPPRAHLNTVEVSEGALLYWWRGKDTLSPWPQAPSPPVPSWVAGLPERRALARPPCVWVQPVNILVHMWCYFSNKDMHTGGLDFLELSSGSSFSRFVAERACAPRHQPVPARPFSLCGMGSASLPARGPSVRLAVPSMGPGAGVSLTDPPTVSGLTDPPTVSLV